MNEPIKIRFSGDACGKLASAIQARIESGDEPETALDAFTRQKTNLVVESRGEAKLILDELEYILAAPDTMIWMDGNKEKALRRVKDELEDEL